MNFSRFFNGIIYIAIFSTMFEVPVSAKNQCKYKKCIHFPKYQEGFVQVPPRKADDGSEIPAAKLFYKEQGKSKKDQPTLVFVHGNGLSSVSWSCQQTELSKKFRTFTIDLRGFGCSEKTDPLRIAYNYELFATDLHVALQELGVKNPIMIGHSLGGAIAMVYNNRYPNELNKMVLVGTSPLFLVPDSYTQPGCDANCPTEVIPTSPTCWPYPSLTESQFVALVALIQEIGFETVVKEIALPLFYNEACQNELADAKNSLIQSFLQEGEDIFFNVESNLFLADLRPILSNITIPTLIGFGTIDATVPIGGSLYLFSQIPGAWLLTFDQKGHVPQVSDYKRFNRALEDFVTGDSTQCTVCPLVRPKKGCKQPCYKETKE